MILDTSHMMIKTAEMKNILTLICSYGMGKSALFLNGRKSQRLGLGTDTESSWLFCFEPSTHAVGRDFDSCLYYSTEFFCQVWENELAVKMKMDQGEARMVPKQVILKVYEREWMNIWEPQNFTQKLLHKSQIALSKFIKEQFSNKRIASKFNSCGTPCKYF